MLTMAEQLGDTDMVMRSLDLRHRTLLELGRLDEAQAAFEAMEDLGATLRQPAHGWLIAAYRASQAAVKDRFEEAERLANEAWRIGQKAYNQQIAALAFTAIMVTLRFQQGRFLESAEFMAGAAESLPTFVALRASMASQYAEAGHLDEARAIFEKIAANDFLDIPRDGFWLSALTGLAPAAAILGDRKRAALLYDMFLPYESRIMVSGGALGVLGDVSATFLGMLATTLGRWDEAERHFERSLETLRVLGGPVFIIRLNIEYARMLLMRVAPGDVDRAVALLSDARASAEELGTEAWASRARGLLDSAQPSIRPTIEGFDT
jgi:tetratricopeptide (TPR) repeat protein